MNRKQKIIISVTGIFIVLLILVGLTYAYFLTRIQGNTNSKSISVTTADLKLTYGDGNGIITGEKIQPGTTLDTKTFTVTNEGNSLVTYGTAFIDMIYQDLSNNKDIDKFEYQDDLIYSLECTSYKTEGLTYNTDGTVQSGTETGECNGVTEGVLPTRTDLSLIITNKIEVGITHVYKLKITYKETGIDQSIDMNKKIEGKIDIIDLKRNSNELNPYSKNKESLAYNIINNAIENTNGTSFNPTPITNIGEQIKSKEGVGEPYIPKYQTIDDEEDDFQSKYFVYSNEVEFNSDTNKFVLSNYKIGKYSDVYKELVGNYIYRLTGLLETSNALKNLQEKEVKTVEVSNLYYIINTTYVETINSSESYNIYKYAEVSNTVSLENELSTTNDNYGKTYYYRGNVKDNFVTFNNMCFKIMRIEGDGSIKLVLYDKFGVCKDSNNLGINDTLTDDSYNLGTGDFGYIKTSDTTYKADFLNSENRTTSAKYILDEWFNTNFNNVKDKLKEDTYCFDSIENITENLKTSKKISCSRENAQKINSYIGMYTTDELALIDGKSHDYNWYFTSSVTNYLKYILNYKKVGTYSWVLTKKTKENEDYAFVYNSTGQVMFEGSIIINRLFITWKIVPTITLKSNVEIQSGDGTINNAYIIK